jgi:hypothetical protein
MTDKDELAWERKRRLAEVFGEVLPETTVDERDPDAQDSDGREPVDSTAEAWLRAQVPPHHG